MDKYEYQVRADQIKSLIEQRRFPEAMDIADTIDWRRVKSFSMLCTISEIYKVNRHYEESRDILLLAYERYPDRANVVYALCELSIKLDDMTDAVEYYKEFVRLKPNDTNRYVLLYKIYDAQEVPIEERIALLEEFKKAEYTEKWCYELAYLYHKSGQESRCVAECDELILWFGDGNFVRKAMELKMKHAPLTKEQQKKYDGVIDEAPIAPSVKNSRNVPDSVPNESNVQTGHDNRNEISSGYNNANYGGEGSFQDIQVQPVNFDKFSTMNLQAELARNMQELYNKNSNIGFEAPYYGETSQLYEPSRAQYMQNLQEYGMQQNVGVPGQTSPGFDLSNAATAAKQSTMMSSVAAENAAAFSNNQVDLFNQGYVQNNASAYSFGAAPNQPYFGSMMNQNVPYPGYEAWQGNVNNVNSGLNNELQKNDAIMQQGFVQGIPVHEVESTDMESAVREPVIYGGESDKQNQVDQYANNASEDLRPASEVFDRNVSENTDEISIESAVDRLFNPDLADLEDEVSGMTLTSEKVDKAKNSSKAEMEKRLTQEGGGQISINIPKEEAIERQITGQIDISDFMMEWNAKKRTGEEQRMERLRQKSISQTSDIMSQLEGVIPGITAAATTPKDQFRSQPIIPIDEVVKDDDRGTVTRTVLSAPSIDGFREERMRMTESGSRINGPKISSITGAIPSILPSEKSIEIEDNDEVEEIEEIEEVTSDNSKNYYGDEASEMNYEDNVEDVSEEEYPEDSDENYSEEGEEYYPEESDENYSEDGEEEYPEESDENYSEEDEEYYPEESDENYSEEGEEYYPEESDENYSEDEEDSGELEESDGKYFPYEVDDSYEEIEEIETIDQPDDMDDMLRTGRLPVGDIGNPGEYGGMSDGGFDGYARESVSENASSKPDYMNMDDLDNARYSRRDFDEDELAIFGRYEGIEEMKAQIVDAMDDMRMQAAFGNVVIVGSELYGRKDIAIDVVKAMQVIDSEFSGKVAKISGEALNKKNIPMTLAKLQNGALIVENASGLTPITVTTIVDTLVNDVESILVVFEDDKDKLEPLLNGIPEAKNVFNVKIDVVDFSNNDLVAYGKGYARELEYSIDEMGELALHTRLSEMDTINHKVSVADVIDIVENAIHHVDRKNMSHFMDVLVGKRYDDEDYIVLREKDFMS